MRIVRIEWQEVDVPEPISRARKQLSEITHIVPIKRGVVVGKEAAPLTYADRLKTILEAFHRREDQGFPSVIRLFEGIHFAKWTLLDGDTRLLLNVVFDGDWYDYLKSLTDCVPSFLHLIWSNCEGWEPVDGQPDKLFSFIKAYQARVSFFYAHHPQHTVKDIDRLEMVARETLSRDHESSREVWARIDSERRPLAFGTRRAAKLKDYGNQEKVELQKGAFTRVIASLYTPAELAGAYLESFGEPLPAEQP